MALYRASRSIRTGNKGYTNKMFRMRIYAQAFTIAAMIAGSYYYKEQRSAQKEVAAAVAQQKAREKHAAWIRELEVRNREDREVDLVSLAGRTMSEGADGWQMQEREKKLSQRRRERQQQQQQQKEQQQQEQQQQEEGAKKAA